MQPRSYKISEAAAEDLEQIWIYTFENWSVDQANHYLNVSISELNYLCLFPESGLDYSYIRKGYLRSKVKSHLIFYRVNNKKNEIEIIRILHEMMDIESQLAD